MSEFIDQLARSTFPESSERALRCADAIRTALDEAVKVAEAHACSDDRDMCGGRSQPKHRCAAHSIAADIEAL